MTTHSRRGAEALRFFLVLGAAALLACGCMDMPIVEPPPGEERPIGNASVVLGPYLTSSDGTQPVLRFVSNRRCVAGLQLEGSGVQRVNRHGSFSLFHEVAIPDASVSEPRRYRLWLDDRAGGEYMLKGLPKSGQAAKLALAGGRADPGRLDAVGNVLRSETADAVVFMSHPFGGRPPEKPEEWATMFFNPLGTVADLGPLWFAPAGDAGLPKQLFPEHAAEGGYWKRDIGALRVIGIDARAFSFESSRRAVLSRLDLDLDPDRRARRWTVVVLSRPVFNARSGDGRVMEALGDRMEMGGVDLVIGGDSPYYIRTRPFTSGGGGGQTRYIGLSDVPQADPGVEPREYVEKLSFEPHVARLWADEGVLEWRVVDLAGQPIDSLTIEAGRDPVETALSKWDAMADAQAVLTLQRELLGLSRQAARAVPDPDREFMLALRFANPSTREFSGRLEWEIPADARWRVEPAVMPFSLQPGQGAVARFSVTPAGGSGIPVLNAVGDDIGVSRESLVIAREKRYEVRSSPDRIRLDGRFRDKAYWNAAPELSGFVNRDTGGPPSRPIQARMAADDQGLVIGISMAAPAASSSDPLASDPDRDRDGPVLENESVEIYVDPLKRGRDYYQFAVNVRNVPYDSSSRDGLGYNPSWQHTTRFGRVGGVETWDAELRIPWAAVGLSGPPSAGSEWGLEIVRNDHSASRSGGRGGDSPAAGPEVVQWAPTFGPNTRAGLYGSLVFSGVPIAPPAQEAAPQPGLRQRSFGERPQPPMVARPAPPPVPEPPVPEL